MHQKNAHAVPVWRSLAGVTFLSWRQIRKYSCVLLLLLLLLPTSCKASLCPLLLVWRCWLRCVGEGYLISALSMPPLASQTRQTAMLTSGSFEYTMKKIPYPVLGFGGLGTPSLVLYAVEKPLPCRAHAIVEERSGRPRARRTLQHCLGLLTGQAQCCRHLLPCHHRHRHSRWRWVDAPWLAKYLSVLAAW